VIATRNIQPGEVICDEYPIASVLHAEQINARCSFCWLPASNLSRCAQCRCRRYCSRDCQRADWPQHRAECRTLVAFVGRHKREPSPQLLLMASIMRVRLASASAYAAFDNLVDNWTLQSDENKETFASLSMIVRELLSDQEWALLGEAFKGADVDAGDGVVYKAIAHGLSRFQCNNWTVCDGEFVAIGSGVYPNVAMLNHSCRPNASVMYAMPTGATAQRGPHAKVRAIERIQAGQEVTLAYIDLAGTRQTRRALLKSGYCFDCQCVRCSDSTDSTDSEEMRKDALASALKFLHPLRAPRVGSCAGFIRTNGDAYCCGVCDATIPLEAVREQQTNAARIDTLFKHAIALRDGVPVVQDERDSDREIESDPLVLLLQCALQRRAVLHPMHADLAAATNALAMLLVEHRRFAAASAWTSCALVWYESVYAPSSPLLALHRLLVARLLVHCANALDAGESLLIDELDRRALAEAWTEFSCPDGKLADIFQAVRMLQSPSLNVIGPLLRAAVPLFESALRVLRCSHGGTHSIVIDAERSAAETSEKIQYDLANERSSRKA
jgi:SET and MYND domain-containing protein